MKTLLILATASLLSAAGGTAYYFNRPAVPSCCAASAETLVSTAAPLASVTPPLTARSIYNLERPWTKDDGLGFHLASLRGKPVVLAMFYSSCTYACPALVSDLKRLRELLPEDVRAETQFVLASFDSVRDTPAVLKAYREHRALDAGWTLLHGDDNAVKELAMVLGVKYKQDVTGQFAHSILFTVLDKDGEIAYEKQGLGGDVSDGAKAVVRIMQPR